MKIKKSEVDVTHSASAVEKIQLPFFFVELETLYMLAHSYTPDKYMVISVETGEVQGGWVFNTIEEFFEKQNQRIPTTWHHVNVTIQTEKA